MKTVFFQKPGFPAETLKVFKANLHTHTTISDGRFTTQQQLDQYAAQNYDVLAITDHGKHNFFQAYDTHQMTMLPGIELHPMGPRGIRWHLLALNVDRSIVPGGIPEDAQKIIDIITASGGIVFAAHPYWCGFTSAEVMSLNGISGIEVSNTSCRYIGREFNMQIWDELLDAGKNYTALAVDDSHRKRDLFRNWTMICAKSNSRADIVDALKQGNFYATQGPEFSKISFDGTIFEAEFTPCTTALLVSRRSNGWLGMVPAIDGPGTGEEVTSLKFDLTGLPRDSYIRCQICDAQGRYAWSQPFRAIQN